MFSFFRASLFVIFFDVYLMILFFWDFFEFYIMEGHYFHFIFLGFGGFLDILVCWEFGEWFWGFGFGFQFFCEYFFGAEMLVLSFGGVMLLLYLIFYFGEELLILMIGFIGFFLSLWVFLRAVAASSHVFFIWLVGFGFGMGLF